MFDQYFQKHASAFSFVLDIEKGNWPDPNVLESLCCIIGKKILDETDFIIGSSGCEISIVFTNDKKIQELNTQWRDQPKPTNVLSFSSQANFKENTLPPLLGDVVLAEETIRRESEIHAISFMDHVSHLLIHGILHLLGFDHQNDEEATDMERLESKLLGRLSILSPYC